MLYLASRSPRRRELLAQLGITPALVDVDVPELRAPGETPADYVQRVAHDKAVAGHRAVADEPDALVLAADTEVVLDDRVFGKPRDAADAMAMLSALSGRTHEVITVVWLVGQAHAAMATSVSRLRFAAMDAAEMQAYVATGEWQGKAGAYAIQGRAAAFVAGLSGSHSGVMGLPLHETYVLLKAAGFATLPIAIADAATAPGTPPAMAAG